jgi:hypothetical protein
MTTSPSNIIALAFLLAGIASAGFGTAEVQAQERTRSGFWLEAGAGTGALRLGCGTCEEPTRSYGETAYLRGGGAFSEDVLWGLEASLLLGETFSTAEGGAALGSESVSLAPVVLWYPWRGGVFVKGGVGLSFGEVMVAVEGGEPSRAGSTGATTTFAIGFDVPLLPRLALTTSAGVYYDAIGDVRVADAYVDDVITTRYDVNLALTFR